jgi:hypothetical protein
VAPESTEAIVSGKWDAEVARCKRAGTHPGAPGNTWQFPFEDQLVVFRQDVEGLFLLNPTARLLWEELRAGASPEASARTFASTFGLSETRAREDIEVTLAQWSEGLLAPIVRGDSRTTSALLLHDFPAKPDAIGIDCVLNGSGFRVMLEPGDLVDEIAPRLARISVPAFSLDSPVATFTLANSPDSVFVFRNGVCIAEEDKTAGARAILLQEMTRLCDPCRDAQAILHAGACGTASGCVVLSGASQAGKSTLCAALMAEGLYCYSDDSAILDRELKVAGMPFPVMLRKSSWPVLDSRLARMEHASIHQKAGVEVRFLPSNLPNGTSPTSPVKALVNVEYKPGAKSTLRPMSAFDTLLALQESGFWVEHDGETVARFLDWIARLPRHKLTYSSIDEAVAAVCSLLI